MDITGIYQKLKITRKLQSNIKINDAKIVYTTKTNLTSQYEFDAVGFMFSFI